MSLSRPWAILLCNFQNNTTAPAFATLSSVSQTFFSDPTAGFSAARYFSDMSHGSVDLSQSKVFGWYTLNIQITSTQADGTPVFGNNPNIQDDVVRLAKQAASDGGVKLSDYTGVVVIMNILTGWAQGASSWSGSAPAPGVVADWRRVDGRKPDGTKGAPGISGGNGTECFGHEMSHGFGLQHNRMDGSSAEYGDRWDIMGAWTENVASTKYSAPDADYGARGPGMNAWNMRGRGWLNEQRVWHSPPGDFVQDVLLRPLHRRDLPGLLAAELPGTAPTNGYPKYLVEYRKKDQWDAGIPKSCILVHRYDGISKNGVIDGFSSVMKGTLGQIDLVVGDEFVDSAGPYSHIVVESIDDVTETAIVRLCCSAAAPSPSVKFVNKSGWSDCVKSLIAGQVYTMGFELKNAGCAVIKSVAWSTAPPAALPGESYSLPSFSFTAPAAGTNLTITVSVMFSDGSVVAATDTPPLISAQQAIWAEMFCQIINEARLRPIPWYEWDPEKLGPLLAAYTVEQRELIQQRFSRVAQSIQAGVRLLNKD
jgi:M6 family metalloprotease-like protein